MRKTEKDEKFMANLNKHRILRARFEDLLRVVDNADGSCTKADDAEQGVVDELRKMGNEALQSWGEKAAIKSAETLKAQNPKSRKNGKKKSIGIASSEK